MKRTYYEKIASELHVDVWQVEAASLLLVDGATIPFITRYRKEVTGSLDEVRITNIRNRLAQLEELDKRREAIVKSLEEQGKLDDELKEKIDAAETLAVLEDIYLPYRPKRRTRATIAREKGLEPLAQIILSQHDLDPFVESAAFVDAEKGVETIEDALSGARDIIAEWVNEDQEARTKMRSLFFEKGVFASKVIPGKETEGQKYKDYFDWEEPVAKAPSHRILAMRRGEKEGFLRLHVAPPEDEALALLEALFIKAQNKSSEQVRLAVHDGYERLLVSSMETEIRAETKKKADDKAIQIFADNLRQLLLAPPLGERGVIGIDPGFRTGCKVVCLNPQGKLVYTDTIYPLTSDKGRKESAEKIIFLCEKYKIDMIAVGNGTGGRQTEA
ncbi:MAG: Tex-like N-terminal domain-containing protein, partial [Thermodesulfobacteriota bacterium]|nr:Tex-like N-terminal domain-containing protein [Thermodesulfobacteriota bacterium]